MISDGNKIEWNMCYFMGISIWVNEFLLTMDEKLHKVKLIFQKKY